MKILVYYALLIGCALAGKKVTDTENIGKIAIKSISTGSYFLSFAIFYVLKITVDELYVRFWADDEYYILNIEGFSKFFGLPYFDWLKSNR
jgi:hypothetical protein